MTSVVVVAARRTAIGSFQGSLSKTPASTLGAECIRQLLVDTKVSANAVDEVIVGHVIQSNCGQNPARIAALNAGLPETCPCVTINKVCGSGMKALHLGMQAILLGDAEVVIAGGQENMSLGPHMVDGAKSRGGQKLGPITMVDSVVHDGLTCAFNHYHMGITAENIAQKYEVTRSDQDQFALDSQKKAAKAQTEGKFKKQIVPIKTKQGEFSHDEYIKLNASIDALKKLRPAFDKNGSVTAGNASGLNDGAAMMMLMSAKKAQNLNLPVLATIRGFAAGGVDPKIMGMGPVPATKKLLEKIRWSIRDVDLMECNEAFASQSIAVLKELGIDKSKVNVNGGAIALGHPIGSSGTRICVDLLHEMLAQNKSRAVATMCIGGGMGVAIAFERKTASKL